jgi:hypothetical protein
LVPGAQTSTLTYTPFSSDSTVDGPPFTEIATVFDVEEGGGGETLIELPPPHDIANSSSPQETPAPSAKRIRRII